MKKIIFLLTFIFALTTCAFAADVSVQINGEIVNFKDEQGRVVNAQIINDRTMVPMRRIFEILGVTIEWDGQNRIVTGVKGATTIKLQIDNPVATKTVNGVKEEIVLDSMPTIVNDRTMVPLRFIAESLDKQVGWDNVNRTAIIIDYGYFSNVLKTRAAALYNFLNMNKTYVEFTVTHNYYDLQNAVNNTSFTAKMNASVLNNLQNAVLTISGTDELSKEIISEGWNSTAFSIQYNDKDILVNSQNAKIKEMFKLGANGTTYTYKDLGLNGMPNTSFDELFRIWAGVEDNSLNINTFSKLKNDFTKLCDLFATTNTSNVKLSSASSSIRYSTYKLEYFDLTKLDNFISGNEHLKLYNMVNKLFFKNDIQKDVMLYDTNNIIINFSVDNAILKVTVVTENNYGEKNEYILELKHM